MDTIPDFDLKSLIFESDVRDLIQGVGIFRRCEQFAPEWLHDLLATHVRRFEYKLGFIDDSKVPSQILYHLKNADSIILIGCTASIHRDISDFRLTVRTSGSLFERDQRFVRELERNYADFSIAGTTAKIEKFKRLADRTPKRLEGRLRRIERPTP